MRFEIGSFVTLRLSESDRVCCERPAIDLMVMGVVCEPDEELAAVIQKMRAESEEELRFVCFRDIAVLEDHLHRTPEGASAGSDIDPTLEFVERLNPNAEPEDQAAMAGDLVSSFHIPEGRSYGTWPVNDLLLFLVAKPAGPWLFVLYSDNLYLVDLQDEGVLVQFDLKEGEMI